MAKKTSELIKANEGKALCALFAENKVDNYAEFARQYGVPGGKSMVKQHIDGLRPISMEAAKAYIKGFGCDLRRISPRLADSAIESAAMIPAKSSDGSMTSNLDVLTPSEKKLIAGFRVASEADRETLLWLANRALKPAKPNSAAETGDWAPSPPIATNQDIPALKEK